MQPRAKISLLLLALVVMVVLFIMFVMAVKKYAQPVATATPTSSPVAQLPQTWDRSKVPPVSSRALIEKAMTRFVTNDAKRSPFHAVWKLSSNNDVMLIGEQLLIQDPSESLSATAAILEDVLKDEGFQHNKVNSEDKSQKSVDTATPYIAVAYEKKSDYCLVSQYPSQFKETELVVLFCGQLDKETQAYREMLEPQLYPDGSHEGDTIIFYPTKIRGDFVMGEMIHPGHTMQWIAKKIDGKWTEIVTGIHETMECTPVDEYAIPEEIFQSCVEKDGSTIRGEQPTG